MQTSAVLVVRVYDFKGAALAKATVSLRPLTAKGRSVPLGYEPRVDAFVAEGVAPGRYEIDVAARGLVAQKRRVEVGAAGARRSSTSAERGCQPSELIIESDDPDDPTHSLLVTGHLRRTLHSALTCWVGQELQDILRAGKGC